MEAARLESLRGPGIAGAMVAGAVIALSLGLAAGHPSPAILTWAVTAAGLAIMGAALVLPFAALLVLAASTILFMTYDLPGGQGINLFDFLLPCVLAASVLGHARRDALEADRRLTGTGHDELRLATRRLISAVIAFYGVAALSIVGMALAGRTATVPTSAFTLIRAIQGLLLFPLGMWWFRSERRIHWAIVAMLVGGVLLTVVDSIMLGTGKVGRAGMTWYLNPTDQPIGGPNEAASTILVLIALLLVRQSMANRVRNLLLLGVSLGMLVATASRSGVLAFGAFTAMVMPRARARWIVLAVIAFAAAIPFIPQDYWTRLGRTLVLERGTFEAYTSLIRVYCWKTAFAVFLDNPLLGVGYVGFSTVSGAYGELRLMGNPAENYFLETASGMGVPGLIALGVVIVRLFQLGSCVRRHAPPGTLAHVMGRYHAPMLIGQLIVNLTGANLVAMVVLGQMSLWMAMMVRSTHMALARASARARETEAT